MAQVKFKVLVQKSAPKKSTKLRQKIRNLYRPSLKMSFRRSSNVQHRSSLWIVNQRSLGANQKHGERLGPGSRRVLTLLWRILTLLWRILTLLWRIRTLFWRILTLLWRILTLFWRSLTLWRILTLSRVLLLLWRILTLLWRPHAPVLIIVLCHLKIKTAQAKTKPKTEE